MSESSKELLRTAKCGDRVDTGFEAYNYDILTNPIY